MDRLWYGLGAVLGAVFLGPFFSGLVGFLVDPQYAGIAGAIAGGLLGLLIAHLLTSGGIGGRAKGGILSSAGGMVAGIAVFLVLVHMVNQWTGVYLSDALVDLKDQGWGAHLLFAYETTPLTLGFWLPTILILAGLAHGVATGETTGDALILLAVFAGVSLLGIKGPAVIRVWAPTWAGASSGIAQTGREFGLSETETVNNYEFVRLRIEKCKTWEPEIPAESSTAVVEIRATCFKSRSGATEVRVLRVFRDGQPVLDKNGLPVLDKNGQPDLKNFLEVLNPGTPQEHLGLPNWSTFHMASQWVDAQLVEGGDIVTASFGKKGNLVKGGGLPLKIGTTNGNDVFYKEGSFGIKFHN